MDVIDRLMYGQLRKKMQEKSKFKRVSAVRFLIDYENDYFRATVFSKEPNDSGEVERSDDKLVPSKNSELADLAATKYRSLIPDVKDVNVCIWEIDFDEKTEKFELFYVSKSDLKKRIENKSKY